MSNRNGRFTLPAEAGMDKEVIRLAEKWGADGIRDSDGTVLSPEITNLGFDVYSTLCMIRVDQKWAKMHKDHCQQKFLMSDPITAFEDKLEIDIQSGYSKEQYEIDRIHDAKKYWQVFDRTLGKEVDKDSWSFLSDSGLVAIEGTQIGHVYTVNFLVFQIWETTSMYNYITNGWTGEHQLGLDPRHPETYAHLMGYLDNWLEAHPETDYVRFTSVAYQFPIVTNENRVTRYQDWCGYHDCTSTLALDQFEMEKGYRLTSEDLVDAGYYNSTDRVPSKAYLDWIDFVNKFVTKFGKDCVEHVHKAGKKAVMFFCDHWIGTEPYGERFDEMGFDGIVNPCINGMELRRMADLPSKNIIKEVRLYPYFFPVNLLGQPLFEGEGGDPVGEAVTYWMKIRRAMLRKCVDRIGFGGYLSLAVKFPEFLDYVEKLTNEFRDICDYGKMSKAYSMPGKVAILDAWGKLRTWTLHVEDWPNGAFAESLTGLPFDFEFLNFEDIKKNGIPEDISVIINYGSANTSLSGGEHWADAEVVAAIRKFVHQGGGFVGVKEPTAYEYQGNYFQLSDVLGVQKENGTNLANRKTMNKNVIQNHFILEDTGASYKLEHFTQAVYASKPSTQILAQKDGNILLSTNEYGNGRAVYMGGFELDIINTRTLMRSIYWAAGLENKLKYWFTSNCNTECTAFPETGYFALINNSGEEQNTTLFNGEGKSTEILLNANEMRWFKI